MQREWDVTVRRIKEVCEVKDLSQLVSARQYAHILIHKTDALDITQVEGILFENLLFTPWARVEHHTSFILSGTWLWKWRRKERWQAEPVSHMIRLAPDAPKRMWTYRMNVIDAQATAARSAPAGTHRPGPSGASGLRQLEIRGTAQRFGLA